MKEERDNIEKRHNSEIQKIQEEVMNLKEEKHTVETDK